MILLSKLCFIRRVHVFQHKFIQPSISHLLVHQLAKIIALLIAILL